MKLVEGLKEGDLEDLVLPLISIDEYETKLDDDAIVIAFYVYDRDPALDLNRFIQKGAVSLLDTDVSPAPNEDGYYLVFVELVRDHKLPDRILDIASALTGLTGITKWQGTFFDHDGVHDLNREVLNSMVRLVSTEDDADNLGESLAAFFKDSVLEDMWLEGRILHLEGLYESFNLELVDFGPFDEVKEHNMVLSQGLRLDEQAQANISALQRLLGDHWLVEHLENHVLVSQPWAGDDVVLLRI